MKCGSIEKPAKCEVKFLKAKVSHLTIKIDAFVKISLSNDTPHPTKKENCIY